MACLNKLLRPRWAVDARKRCLRTDAGSPPLWRVKHGVRQHLSDTLACCARATRTDRGAGLCGDGAERFIAARVHGDGVGQAHQRHGSARDGTVGDHRETDP
jgi:hypothetical protein